eukprot:363813-Chlamydomonas_euryale.AAC.3
MSCDVLESLWHRDAPHVVPASLYRICMYSPRVSGFSAGTAAEDTPTIQGPLACTAACALPHAYCHMCHTARYANTVSYERARSAVAAAVVARDGGGVAVGPLLSLLLTGRPDDGSGGGGSDGGGGVLCAKFFRMAGSLCWLNTCAGIEMLGCPRPEP